MFKELLCKIGLHDWRVKIETTEDGSMTIWKAPCCALCGEMKNAAPVEVEPVEIVPLRPLGGGYRAKNRPSSIQPSAWN